VAGRNGIISASLLADTGESAEHRDGEHQANGELQANGDHEAHSETGGGES
jgi:hypothetical protein